MNQNEYHLIEPIKIALIAKKSPRIFIVMVNSKKFEAWITGAPSEADQIPLLQDELSQLKHANATEFSQILNHPLLSKVQIVKSLLLDLASLSNEKKAILMQSDLFKKEFEFSAPRLDPFGLSYTDYRISSSKTMGAAFGITIEEERIPFADLPLINISSPDEIKNVASLIALIVDSSANQIPTLILQNPAFRELIQLKSIESKIRSISTLRELDRELALNKLDQIKPLRLEQFKNEVKNRVSARNWKILLTQIQNANL